MRYKVELSKEAKRDLRKLDPHTSLMITDWLRKNLEGCENPRAFGKPLKGTYKGEWRYRVGDYRIISEIKDDKILILVTAVGHRSEIYKQRRILHE